MDRFFMRPDMSNEEKAREIIRKEQERNFEKHSSEKIRNIINERQPHAENILERMR